MKPLSLEKKASQGVEARITLRAHGTGCPSEAASKCFSSAPVVLQSPAWQITAHDRDAGHYGPFWPLD